MSDQLEHDPEVRAKRIAEMQAFSVPSVPDRLSALEATVRRIEVWINEQVNPQNNGGQG